jgi:hypothetical protein
LRLPLIGHLLIVSHELTFMYIATALAGLLGNHSIPELEGA